MLYMLFKDRDSNTVTVLSTELPLGGSDLSYWILLWKRSSSISEKDWVLLSSTCSWTDCDHVTTVTGLTVLTFLKKKLLLLLGCFVSVFESETKCESHSHIFMSFWNQICNSTDYIYFNLMIYKFTQQQIGDITNDSFTVWYVLKIQSSLEKMCPIYQWKSCMAHFHQMYNLCCDWYLLDLSVV